MSSWWRGSKLLQPHPRHGCQSTKVEEEKSDEQQSKVSDGSTRCYLFLSHPECRSMACSCYVPLLQPRTQDKYCTESHRSSIIQMIMVWMCDFHSFFRLIAAAATYFYAICGVWAGPTMCCGLRGGAIKSFSPYNPPDVEGIFPSCLLP